MLVMVMVAYVVVMRRSFQDLIKNQSRAEQTRTKGGRGQGTDGRYGRVRPTDIKAQVDSIGGGVNYSDPSAFLAAVVVLSFGLH